MTSNHLLFQSFLLMGVIYMLIALVTILIVWRMPQQRIRGSRAMWVLVMMMLPFFGILAFGLFGREPEEMIGRQHRPRNDLDTAVRQDPKAAETDVYSGPSDEVLDDLYGRNRGRWQLHGMSFWRIIIRTQA